MTECNGIKNSVFSHESKIHVVSHNFSDRILVPYMAITNSWDICKGDFCEMQDGTKAEIIGVENLHMATAEANKISYEMYKLSAWALMNQWYIRGVKFDSACFVVLTLKKIIHWNNN